MFGLQMDHNITDYRLGFQLTYSTRGPGCIYTCSISKVYLPTLTSEYLLGISDTQDGKKHLKKFSLPTKTTPFYYFEINHSRFAQLTSQITLRNISLIEDT